MTDDAARGIRAGEPDRDAAIERLTASFTEGRLELAEYDTRLAKVMDATTVGEVEAAVADLPVPRAQVERMEADKQLVRQRKKWRKLRRETGQWAGGAVFFTGIWGAISIAVGEATFYWPVFPVGIWGVAVLADALSPAKKKKKKKGKKKSA
ncbi:DUF1707 SHOCT-like domain-containing protein [Amycolatopsis suaedae]|uniref:DUF1707 domain-containing protein n=1 Tax=Amycolatopsis suaedae TaxID=2510978 RepID=A0A4Q7J6U9_9PSEU|nr:DUF1707 domain-containing protein [Amycolatopsis suaedae]RZQ62502.1 DUF1707 domain-containing protein [Amycolatopsis suaedae]